MYLKVSCSFTNWRFSSETIPLSKSRETSLRRNLSLQAIFFQLRAQNGKPITAQQARQIVLANYPSRRKAKQREKRSHLRSGNILPSQEVCMEKTVHGETNRLP